MASPKRSPIGARRLESETSQNGEDPSLHPASGSSDVALNNTAAFAHNAAFPSSDAPNTLVPDRLAQIPDLHIRKPSLAGLHLQTGLLASSSQPPQNALESAIESADTAERPTSSPQPDPARLASRWSWGSAASASPNSTASSPAFGALGDVTPLPSPLVPSLSTEDWMNKTGRPHSSSSASIERDKAAGLLSPVIAATSPQRKKKVYGHLAPTPPTTSHGESGTPERIRAHSEYVPDHLQNARPRVVTGPNVPVPNPSQLDSKHQDTTLHRELYLAKHKPSLDKGVGVGINLDPSSTLPSPPASTHTTDEGDDLDNSSTQLLTVRDPLTHHTTVWKTLSRLGTGSFSEVWLATPANRPSSTSIDSGIAGVSDKGRSLVAIKVVSHEANDDKEQRMDTSIKREIEILQSMSHPCLPQLYAFEEMADRALLVLNYCAGGDLFEAASTQRELLSIFTIQRMFAELVAAVSCLHASLIAHRDIKLESASH